MVIISGVVVYSGKYVLVNKKELVYNIVMWVGGLIFVVNLEGMKIKRFIK